MDSKFTKLEASVEPRKHSELSSGKAKPPNQKGSLTIEQSEKQKTHQTNRQRKPPIPNINKNASAQQRKGSVKISSASKVPKTLNRVDSRGLLSAQSQRGTTNSGAIEEGLRRRVGELTGRVGEL